MFNQIGQPRFNSPLIRFFGMKIGGAAAPTLAPEIAPSFDVNQQDDPQLFFLRGERRMTFSGTNSAVVGEYGRCRIRNPATSGVLIVIESIAITATTGFQFGATGNTSDETTPVTPSNLDLRYTGSGTAICSRGTNAAAITDTSYGIIGSSNSAEREFGIVIPPGWSFYGQGQSTNVAVTFLIKLRERPIPAEELATG